MRFDSVCCVWALVYVYMSVNKWESMSFCVFSYLLGVRTLVYEHVTQAIMNNLICRRCSNAHLHMSVVQDNCHTPTGFLWPSWNKNSDLKFFCFSKSTSIHIFMCVRVCARLCEITSEQMCNLVCLLTFMYMCERVHVCVIKLHGSAA